MLGLYGVCGVVPLVLDIPSRWSKDCERLCLLRRGDISQPDPPYNEEDKRLFIYKVCAKASVLKVRLTGSMKIIQSWLPLHSSTNYILDGRH
jgi:hypothetical protein